MFLRETANFMINIKIFFVTFINSRYSFYINLRIYLIKENYSVSDRC